MKVFKDRNKELEIAIDQYLKALEESAIVFCEGVKAYMLADEVTFLHHTSEIIVLEKEADDILKQLKFILYRYNLMPDLNADILSLMDSLDEIGDVAKKVLSDLKVERPKIMTEWQKDYIQIAETVLKAVHSLLDGIKGFLTSIRSMDVNIKSVKLYESEVDRMEYLLKCKVFESPETKEFSLCDKMQQRYFIHKIAELSDVAEAISAKLEVLKYKRSI